MSSNTSHDLSCVLAESSTGPAKKSAIPIHVSTLSHHFDHDPSGHSPAADIATRASSAGTRAVAPVKAAQTSAHSHNASAEPTSKHASSRPARAPASLQASSDQASVQAVLTQGIAADRPVQLDVSESVQLLASQSLTPGSLPYRVLSVAVQSGLEQVTAKAPQQGPLQDPNQPAPEDPLLRAAQEAAVETVLQQAVAEAVQHGAAQDMIHQPVQQPHHSLEQEAQAALAPSPSAAVNEAEPAQYSQRTDISCLYIEADSDDEDGLSYFEYDNSLDDIDDDDEDEFIVLTTANGGMGMMGPH